MDTVFKSLDVQAKDIGDRMIEFTASTEAVDRDFEMILASGWQLDNFMKNPVVLFAHDHYIPAVAKGEKVWIEDGKLMMRVKFPAEGVHEYADMLYKLYKTGFMTAVSVGFKPLDSKEFNQDGRIGRMFTKQELLELSLVNVPANQEALIHRSKSIKDAWVKNVLTTEEMDKFHKVIEDAMKNAKVEPIKDENAIVKAIEKLAEDIRLQTVSVDFYRESLKEIKKDLEELKKQRDVYDVLLLNSAQMGEEDEPLIDRAIKALKDMQKENFKNGN